MTAAPIELTAEEIAELRRKVCTAHLHRTFISPVVWVQYINGPLDGIRTPMEAANARNQFVAWSVVRRGGLVQVMHTRTSTPGVFRFQSIESGVR